MMTGIFIVPSFIKSTMRIFLTRELKQNIAVISAVSIMLLSILFSENMRTAASLSVSNCLNIVIPSIFPMTVISFFVMETGFSVKLKHLTEKLTIKLFGLSGVSLEGMLLGLTGGYNTAVKCAVILKEKYPDAANQAKRIALFFMNPGISFTTLLAGAYLSGSIKAGIRLYAEAVFYNLFLAFLYNRFSRISDKIIVRTETKSVSDAFVSAVKSASAAIISISFNIIFFSCLVSITGEILPLQASEVILTLLSEVSSGVIFSTENCPFYITAGITAFGGLCIFIQNLEDIKKLGIRPVHFLGVRIIHGFLTGITEYAYSLIFPDAVYSSALITVKFSSSGNPVGTAALLFLCVIYLFAVRSIKSPNLRQRK